MNVAPSFTLWGNCSGNPGYYVYPEQWEYSTEKERKQITLKAIALLEEPLSNADSTSFQVRTLSEICPRDWTVDVTIADDGEIAIDCISIRGSIARKIHIQKLFTIIIESIKNITKKNPIFLVPA